MEAMKTFFIVVLLLFPSLSSAWSGYDWNTGNHIEIESGNLVRLGQEIEVYDYATDDYIYVEVESIRSSGSGAVVEVYDYENGEYRIFEME